MNEPDPDVHDALVALADAVKELPPNEHGAMVRMRLLALIRLLTECAVVGVRSGTSTPGR